MRVQGRRAFSSALTAVKTTADAMSDAVRRRQLAKWRKERESASERKDLRAESDACLEMVKLQIESGDFEEALETVAEAGALYSDNEMRCERFRADCMTAMQRHTEALAHRNAHLALARAQDDAVEIQRALTALGGSLMDLYHFRVEGDGDGGGGGGSGDDGISASAAVAHLHEEALEAHEESLALIDHLNVGSAQRRDMKWRCLFNIGTVYDARHLAAPADSHQQRVASTMALQKFRKALELATGLSDPGAQALIHMTTGALLQRLDRYSDAIDAFRRAQTLAENVRDLEGQVEALCAVGSTYETSGDPEKAKAPLRKAYRLVTRPSARNRVNLITSEKVRTVLRRVRRTLRLKATLKEARRAGNIDTALAALEALGDLACEVAPAVAIKHYSALLELAATHEQTERNLAPIHGSLAMTYADMGQLQLARKHYELELDALRCTGNDMSILEALTMLATWLRENPAAASGRDGGGSGDRYDAAAEGVGYSQEDACPSAAEASEAIDTTGIIGGSRSNVASPHARMSLGLLTEAFEVSQRVVVSAATSAFASVEDEEQLEKEKEKEKEASLSIRKKQRMLRRARDAQEAYRECLVAAGESEPPSLISALSAVESNLATTTRAVGASAGTNTVGSSSESEDEASSGGDSVAIDIELTATDSASEGDGDGASSANVAGQKKNKKKRRPDLTRRNEKGETRLHASCISGDLKDVKWCIENGSAVSTHDNFGWSPLHEVCNHGFEEILGALLSCKNLRIDDAGGPNCEGLTPLMDAASAGFTRICRMLVEADARLDLRDHSGRTALDYAKNAEHEDTAEYLSKAMAERGISNDSPPPSMTSARERRRRNRTADLSTSTGPREVSEDETMAVTDGLASAMTVSHYMSSNQAHSGSGSDSSSGGSSSSSSNSDDSLLPRRPGMRGTAALDAIQSNASSKLSKKKKKKKKKNKERVKKTSGATLDSSADEVEVGVTEVRRRSKYSLADIAQAHVGTEDAYAEKRRTEMELGEESPPEEESSLVETARGESRPGDFDDGLGLFSEEDEEEAAMIMNSGGSVAGYGSSSDVEMVGNQAQDKKAYEVNRNLEYAEGESEFEGEGVIIVADGNDFRGAARAGGVRMPTRRKLTRGNKVSSASSGRTVMHSVTSASMRRNAAGGGGGGGGGGSGSGTATTTTTTARNSGSSSGDNRVSGGTYMGSADFEKEVGGSTRYTSGTGVSRGVRSKRRKMVTSASSLGRERRRAPKRRADHKASRSMANFLRQQDTLDFSASLSSSDDEGAVPTTNRSIHTSSGSRATTAAGVAVATAAAVVPVTSSTSVASIATTVVTANATAGLPSATALPPMSIAVSFSGTFDEITVLSRHPSDTVSWLVSEISLAYQQRYGGVAPAVSQLVRVGSGGTVLDPHAHLRRIFASSARESRGRAPVLPVAKVEAVVTGWTPSSNGSLLERYRAICDAAEPVGDEGVALVPGLYARLDPEVVTRFASIGAEVGPRAKIPEEVSHTRHNTEAFPAHPGTTAGSGSGSGLCVDLSGLGLRGHRLRDALAALRHEKGLRELRLGRNGFGDEGATALSRVLWAWPQLTLLDLSANALTGAGIATVLSASLPRFVGHEQLHEISAPLSELTSLDLSWSDCTNLEVSCLSRVVRRCKWLRSLRLMGCIMPPSLRLDIGMRSALSAAPCLKYIAVGSVQIAATQQEEEEDIGQQHQEERESMPGAAAASVETAGASLAICLALASNVRSDWSLERASRSSITHLCIERRHLAPSIASTVGKVIHAACQRRTLRSFESYQVDSTPDGIESLLTPLLSFDSSATVNAPSTLTRLVLTGTQLYSKGWAALAKWLPTEQAAALEVLDVVGCCAANGDTSTATTAGSSSSGSSSDCVGTRSPLGPASLLRAAATRRDPLHMLRLGGGETCGRLTSSHMAPLARCSAIRQLELLHVGAATVSAAAKAWARCHGRTAGSAEISPAGDSVMLRLASSVTGGSTAVPAAGTFNLTGVTMVADTSGGTFGMEMASKIVDSDAGTLGVHGPGAMNTAQEDAATEEWF